jgi:C4-dicarboxylate-binding protein DctP
MVKMMKVLFALCLAAPGRAGAAAKPRVIRLGISPHENEGHASPYLRAAKAFKTEIENDPASGLKVEIVDIAARYPLRFKRDDGAMDALAAGALDIAGVTTTAVARRYEPRLHLFDLPFVFSDSAQVEKVVSGPLGETLAGRLPAAGLKELAYTYSGGFRVVAADRPIRSAQDLAGLRVWVTKSPYLEAEFSAWGAAPVTVASGELSQQLAQEGKIDAEESTYNFLDCWSPGLLRRFAYLNEMDNDFYVTVMLANTKFLDSLDAGQRAAVIAAARKTAAVERAETLRDNAVIAERLAARGLTRVRLSPAVRAELAARAASVRDRYSREVDATILPAVNALDRRPDQTASR